MSLVQIQVPGSASFLFSVQRASWNASYKGDRLCLGFLGFYLSKEVLISSLHVKAICAVNRVLLYSWFSLHILEASLCGLWLARLLMRLLWFWLTSHGFPPLAAHTAFILWFPALLPRPCVLCWFQFSHHPAWCSQVSWICHLVSTWDNLQTLHLQTSRLFCSISLSFLVFQVCIP